MHIIWYGTASLLLQDENTTIAFDPFCKLPVNAFTDKRGFLPYEQEFRQAFHIFVTHGHFDHIYHIPYIYENMSVDLYCTQAPSDTLSKSGFPANSIHLIKPGDCIKIGAFEISAYQSRHCRFDLPLIKQTVFNKNFWKNPIHTARLLSTHLHYPEKKEILFYEIKYNKKRIQILGSMNLAKKVKYPIGADILILPLQGRSDLDTFALDIVKRLKPKSILLDHYDNTFPPLTCDVDISGFMNNLQEQFNIPCSPLEECKKVTII